MVWARLFEPFERLPVSDTLTAWYAELLERLGKKPDPFAMALLGGRYSATPGQAFLAGYQAALRVLWPAAPWTLGAFCVTEKGAVRPVEMSTQIRNSQVSGRKDFVTAAEYTDWLLVAAREDGDAVPARIVVGTTKTNVPGIRLERLPPLPFMPDIDHARLYLQEVPVEQLPGDGWSDYVKPFRTIEDLYVLTALLAWVHSVAQQDSWPESLRLRILSLLAACGELSRQSPQSVCSHLLLAGSLAELQALMPGLDQAFCQGSPEYAELWLRDKEALTIAGYARERRLRKAVDAVPMF